MEVLILTTNSLEGYEIEKYHGYVSSKFVTGVNWFRDIASIGADIFGGVVNSYTEEIVELEEMAMENLKSLASSYGMNCILGVKIDVEPIFNQGTTMFMISAIGTAVRVKDLYPELGVQEKIRMKIKNAIENTSLKSLKSINLDEFETLPVNEVRKAVNNLETSSMENLIRVMLEYLNRHSTCSTKGKKKFKIIGEALIKYERNTYMQYIFPNIDKNKARLLKLLNVIDYGKLYEEFKNHKGAEPINYLILALGVTPLNVYPSMKNELKEIIDYLDERYNNKVTTTSMGLISKSEGWVCKGCGAKVSLDVFKCHVCFKDRYGLPSDLMYRHKIDYARNILGVLNSLENDLDKI